MCRENEKSMRNEKSRIGVICMTLGALLILGTLALFLKNQWEANRAEVASSQALEQVKQCVDIQRNEKKETEAPEIAPLEQVVVETTETTETTEPVDEEMLEAEIDGRTYIGYLAIPALGLELPVQSQWSYDNLAVSPCRYYGSTKTHDLVIAAHNYVTHFARLYRLLPGDQVYFTDMEGQMISYQVEEVDTLVPSAVEEMTDGNYDLTLFTCTYGGSTRVTVRCVQVSETEY
jgi:sortase A